MKKNQNASALGKLGKGKSKSFTPEELEKRRKRMQLINKKKRNENT